MRTHEAGKITSELRHRLHFQFILVQVVGCFLVALSTVQEGFAASGSCAPGAENPCDGQCCGTSCIDANRTCCSRWNGTSYVYKSCAVGDGCCNGNCCPSGQCCSHYDDDLGDYVYSCCDSGKVCSGGTCCDPSEYGCEGECCDSDSYQCCYNDGDHECPTCPVSLGGEEYFVCYQCDSTPKDGNSEADDCHLCDNNPDDENEDNNDCYLCDSTPNEIPPNGGQPVTVLDDCYVCDDPYDSDDPTNLKNKNNSCYLCKNKIAGTQNDDCYRCDFKDASGDTYAGENPEKDDALDSCYPEDYDDDGTLDSCCSNFKVELTFEAVFPGRSTSMAGVGEIGTLKVIPAIQEASATYRSSNEDCVFIDDGNGITRGGWVAGELDEPCTANLCATINGCENCVTLTVTPPTSTRMERVNNNTYHVQGTASAGMYLYYFLEPSNVSFEFVGFGEDTCPAINKSGIYLNKSDHPPWGPLSILRPTSAEKGSRMNGIDICSSSKANWENGGGYTYVIPTLWFDSDDIPHEIDTQTSPVVIRPDGHTTKTKGGQNAEAAVNDPSSGY